MNQHALQQPIDELWERRDSLSSATGGTARQAVEAALDALDQGTVRVAEPTPGGWQVNQWLKKAVLLSFRLTDSAAMEGAGRCAGVRQGPAEVRRLGREPLPRGRLPRRAWARWCAAPPISRPARC